MLGASKSLMWNTYLGLYTLIINNNEQPQAHYHASDVRFQNKTNNNMHAYNISVAHIIKLYRTTFIINSNGRTFCIQTWRSCLEGQWKLVSMPKYFCSSKPYRTLFYYFTFCLHFCSLDLPVTVLVPWAVNFWHCLFVLQHMLHQLSRKSYMYLFFLNVALVLKIPSLPHICLNYKVHKLLLTHPFLHAKTYKLIVWVSFIQPFSIKVSFPNV